MDNNFISLNRASDWENGIMSNVKLQNNKIQIDTSRRYINEKTIKLDTMGINSTVKACTVGDIGDIYYLDTEYKIRIYDTDTGNAKILLDKSYKNYQTQIQYSMNKLYVCYTRKESQIDVISVETGKIEDTIKTISGASFVCIGFNVDAVGNIYILNTLGMLHCINKSLNYKDSYDLNKLLDIDFTSCVESRLLLKAYKCEYVFIYDKLKNELIYINLDSKKTKITYIENISSLGIFKNYIVLNKEEDIKSSIYTYELKTGYIEKLPFIAGKSNNIEFDKKGKIYIYNFESDVINIISIKKGISYNLQENAYKGVYYSRIFDCTRDNVLWDKLMLDSYIPVDCMVVISYYAYDEHELFYKGQAYSFSDFITDVNISLQEKEDMMKNRWKGSMTNVKKALFRDARGRYLIIKIELWGTSIITPTISSMRVYYDRQTYSKYLPEIYTDESKDGFLDRYLSLFETFIQDIEEKIDFISNNFDANKASSEMLRWLCDWLDIEIDLTWSDEKLRRLINRAPYIFKRRGTKESICEILEIYLGTAPIIIEDFQLEYMRQNAEMRILADSLYGNNVYGFTVLVKLSKDLSDDEKITVKKILDSESPAYCTYRFIALEPWMALDKHTYLGVNSQILNWSELRLDGKCILPYNAILKDRETQVEIRRKNINGGYNEKF